MGQLQAWFDISMTVMLLILIAVVAVVQNHVSARLDEAMQTASDYAVLVDDPEAEDCDPDVWQQFFSQFGHVTFVTVAKNNGPLMVALANRRAVMREIIMVIGNGTPGETEQDESGVITTTWDGMSFKEKIRHEVEHEGDPAPDGKTKTRKLIAMTGGAYRRRRQQKPVEITVATESPPPSSLQLSGCKR
jgi:hypothetical protein